MTPGLQSGLIAVGAVVVVALLLRNLGSSRGDAASVPVAPPPEPPDRFADAPEGTKDDLEDADDDGVEDHLVVAVAGDGSAFVPDRHVVRIVPPEEEGEEWKVGAGIKSSRLRAERAISMMTWHAGEIRGVRVVRGGADEFPWRLEALGRDGEYISFDFESSDAAEAAKALFEHQGIVELGEDEDGHPVPPSAEQFDEARRISRETEAELGRMDDEDTH